MKSHILKLTIILVMSSSDYSFGQSCKRLLDSVIKIYNSSGSAKAIPVAEKACKVCEKEDNIDNYVDALRDLATGISDTGNASGALKIYKKALRLNQQYKGQKKVAPEILYDMSTLYSNADSALYYLNLGLSIVEHTSTSNSYDYADYLNKIAKFYVSESNTAAAESTVKKALQILQGLPNHIGNPVTLRTLEAGAIISSEKADYKTTIQIQEYLVGEFKKTSKSDPIAYLASLNNLAESYYNFGKYQKAADIFETVADTLKAKGDLASYIVVMNNLSSALSELNNSGKAQKILDEILKLTNNDQYRNEYATALNNIGILQGEQKKYADAIVTLRHALRVRENLYTRKNQLYIETLGSLSSCYRDNREFSKSISLADSTLSLAAEVIGTQAPGYGDDLKEAALCYWADKQFVKAGDLLKQEWDNLSAQIKNNFYGLSEGERSNLLNKFYSEFQFYGSFVAEQNRLGNHSYNSWLYNIELERKGLLLFSSELFSNAISETGDTTTTKLFVKWKKIKTFLATQSALPKSQRSTKVDSLEAVVQSTERTIARESEGFKKTITGQNTTWDGIQIKLTNEEAAIEFVKYDAYNGKDFTDTSYIAAMILRTGNSSPVWVPLFSLKKFINLMAALNDLPDDQAKVERLYSRNSATGQANPLFSLAWQPLEKYLSGVTRIYFSPVSVLNNLSFQALRTDDGKYLVEKYDLYQVPSTRDILRIKSQSDEKITAGMKAEMFGGVNYNYVASAMGNPATTNSNVDLFNAKPSRMSRDNTDGKLWLYLPGSLNECRSIKGYLTKAALTVTLLDSSNASEENFKALSGNNAPDILHVSTHGYYYENSSLTTSSTITRSVRSTIMYNQDPLVRSGLILANANVVWTGNNLPANIEDGILTASEISNLDFRRVKLVVLSACRTGLGDISGDESSYGLQRGFKLAGVSNIMMSLWRISDEKTPKFMTDFYKNLADGMGIHDSYRQAQLKLCKNYAPYYWGAFVLSD